MSTSYFVLADRLKIGLQVRLLRILRGMRQVDLAESSGVTQADVSALERGKAISPSAKRRILAGMGLEPVLTHLVGRVPQSTGC